MNEPAEKPTDDQHGRPREENPEKEEVSAHPRGHGRVKQALKAGTVAVLATLIASLERLKSRAGGQTEGREEAREDKGASRHAAEPKKAVEATLPLPRSRLRRVLTDVMLILVAAIIGMSFAYRLLSKVLSDQSEKIRIQMEEIKAYNLENQEKATHIAELMKEVDMQRAKLIEAEKRLSETVGKPPEPESRAKDTEPRKQAPKIAIAKTVQPSQASTFKPASAPAKTGNCDLLAGDQSAEALKRCLDNFNRK